MVKIPSDETIIYPHLKAGFIVLALAGDPAASIGRYQAVVEYINARIPMDLLGDVRAFLKWTCQRRLQNEYRDANKAIRELLPKAYDILQQADAAKLKKR